MDTHDTRPVSRTLRAGPFAVTLEVPGAVARLARPVVRALRRGDAATALGGLEMNTDHPPLNVRPGDSERSMEFFRARPKNPTRPGHAVDSLAPEVKLPDTDLGRAVATFAWYHTIELPEGIVTPGIFDHRQLVPHYGIPNDLTGKRVLDIATFDGFWAFQFERRGAEVFALDLDRLSDQDFPPPVREKLLAEGLDHKLPRGFDIAKQALGSKAQHVTSNVYDLDPAKLGQFDLVHIADVLLHLERPIDALRRVRSVTRGRALIVDAYDPELSHPDKRLFDYQGGWWSNTWWVPSIEALAQLVLDAGFSSVRLHATYNLAAVDELRGHWRAILIADA